jgi:hypothetical protein
VASADVQLPLIPDGKFKLHSVITNKDLGVFTKADWTHGVTVGFEGAEPVEVLEISTAN